MYVIAASWSGQEKKKRRETENDGRNYKKYAHAKYGLTSTLQFWVIEYGKSYNLSIVRIPR